MTNLFIIGFLSLLFLLIVSHRTQNIMYRFALYLFFVSNDGQYDAIFKIMFDLNLLKKTLETLSSCFYGIKTFLPLFWAKITEN